jgi:hypothetical protein
MLLDGREDLIIVWYVRHDDIAHISPGPKHGIVKGDVLEDCQLSGQRVLVGVGHAPLGRAEKAVGQNKEKTADEDQNSDDQGFGLVGQDVPPSDLKDLDHYCTPAAIFSSSPSKIWIT